MALNPHLDLSGSNFGWVIKGNRIVKLVSVPIESKEAYLEGDVVE